MNKLKDKVIVVTGGSGLLGRAVMERLRAEGAVAISADIGEPGSEEAIHCDVTKDASVIETVEKIKSRYGVIDGWVNSAYPRTKDWGTVFENVESASWKENVDMQLNSVFTCCQAVTKVMKAQKHGSIVNIASIYGVVGPDFAVYEGTSMTTPAAYSAIKGGIINFTRYLASYFGPDGVRINCVSPGGIFDHQSDEFIKRYEHRTPMRRMGTPQDIAPAIAFLLSDDAAYITGQNLVIDGGWTAI